MNSFNRWLDKFCYKHRKFGIRNLMKYIVVLNIAVYLLSMIDTNGIFMQYFYFSPWLVLKGQVWRLFTYVFIPVDSNPFFFAIMQYFYYFIGTHLESEWGSGRFTMYYIMSVVTTALFGVVAYALTKSPFLILINASFINMSLFFAFATMYPDAQVMLFFFIPIKMKWLALANAVYYLYEIISGFSLFPFNLLPLASLITYFLFFGSTLMSHLRRLSGRSPSASKRRPKPIDFEKERKKQVKKARKDMGAGSRSAPHTRKCAVCGRTDAEFPNLEFRFCSKCGGYHCFCSEHINSHVHFTE